MSQHAALFDAHVHFHRSFRAGAFLDAAARNVARGAGELGVESDPPGMLLFAERERVGSELERLQRASANEGRRSWQLEETAEEFAWAARRSSGPPLYLVGGTQAETREGLEVLALCCGDHVPSGRGLAETVEAAVSAGAVPVIPWGFGKWWGRRGRRVARLLDGPLADHVFLGDNAGRPSGTPRPWLFELARERHVPLLPGSDPLPLAAHETRPGQLGFALELELDAARPGASVRLALRERRRQPSVYGETVGLPGFLRDQLLLRAPRFLTERRPPSVRQPGRET